MILAPECKIVPYTQGTQRYRINQELWKAGDVIGVVGTKPVKDGDDKIRIDYVVNTVRSLWRKKIPPELTRRLPDAVLEKAVQILMQNPEGPLGIGSVSNPDELKHSIEVLGMMFAVSYGSGVGGWRYSSEPKGQDANGFAFQKGEFVKICHDNDVWCAQAAPHPDRFGVYINRNDGNEPDTVKIFPAWLYGPETVAGYLAPIVRREHAFLHPDDFPDGFPEVDSDMTKETDGYGVMMTGKVRREQIEKYRKKIEELGLRAMFGAGDVLRDIEAKNNNVGDPKALEEKIDEWLDVVPLPTDRG